MKTPTLIVRLIGLYLLMTCSFALFQIQKAPAMVPGFQAKQNQMVGDFQLYAWLGLLVGLGATIFAGPLARVLTFDSEPKGKTADSTDRFLGR